MSSMSLIDPQAASNGSVNKAEALKNKAVQPLAGSAGMREMRAEKVSQEFEALFLAQMLKGMFDTVPENELTGAGNGEEIFQDMLVDEYSKMISQAGGIGVADSVKRQLLNVQEVPDDGGLRMERGM